MRYVDAQIRERMKTTNREIHLRGGLRRRRDANTRRRNVARASTGRANQRDNVLAASTATRRAASQPAVNGRPMDGPNRASVLVPVRTARQVSAARDRSGLGAAPSGPGLRRFMRGGERIPHDRNGPTAPPAKGGSSGTRELVVGTGQVVPSTSAGRPVQMAPAPTLARGRWTEDRVRGMTAVHRVGPKPQTVGP